MTSPQTPLDAIWQRTCQQSDFDPARLAAALGKNEHSSYGLTLVLGCPLPPTTADSIEEMKDAYREIVPDRIRFSDRATDHLTVYGLKRSRPEPFSQQELAPLLEGLGTVLHAELGSLPALAVCLRGSVVDDKGTILVCGQESERLIRLRAAIARIDGVDRLKSPGNHITIGQFTRPFGSAGAYRRALDAIEPLRDRPIGELAVREIKLIYYRHRLLGDVVGQQVIDLPVRDRTLGQGNLLQ